MFRFFKLCRNVNNLLKYKCVTYTLPSTFKCVQPNHYKTILGLNILSWLGFWGEDEKKESELIMTLKRGVLAYNRQEYNKAEQLLHVALRIAQQQFNEQGITYCFDLMANVAFDRHQHEKAKKLFVSVLKRLLNDGVPQDDLKVIHICLKMARINHLMGETENAYVGYNWCLKQIENKRNDNFDAKVLYGVIQDWYAQFLLDLGEVKRSFEHLQEAYSVCSEVVGQNSEQCMLLLNDLGTTSWRAGDTNKAENYYNDALKLGNRLEDKSHVGVIHANLGLIFLQNGVIDMAEKYCGEALALGNQHNNKESVEQANYCLEQIKTNLSK